MQEKYKKLYLLNSKTNKFNYKISRAKDVINEFISICKYPYVSFSGGKDSLCMLILLKLTGHDIPIFTQEDDLSHNFQKKYCLMISELLDFSKHHYCYSKVSALNQLKTGLEISGTFSHVYKKLEKEFEYDGVMIGLRAEESKSRKYNIFKRGELFKKKNGIITCYPLAFWSGVDVFSLILSEDIPYIEIYDKDNEKMPHEIRFSWIINPEGLRLGNAQWVKKNYPEQFFKLCNINPILRSYL